jgi:regulator of sigma E protease
LYQTRKGPVEALLAGAEKTVDMSALTLQFIGRMLLGHVSVNHLNGPISIAKMASQSAYSGWTVFISFLAYLSVSLGVLNLLPVPMLDGGHLLYYLIEMVSGRPVPERIQAMCLRIGLALLFMIMCIALLNDLLRL